VSGRDEDIALRLHSAAAGLLRLTRGREAAAGLSAPRLSALSALAHAGPLSLAKLAAESQVRPPTMTRTVDALVAAGLVTRESVPGDRRMVRIAVTDEGRSALEVARRRRVEAIAVRLAALAESERRALERGVELLERLTR
jgi:DNA-binding MarR family transcriptional regulator